jgi:glycosyltransferase involved in cell wall biosynthesis
MAVRRALVAAYTVPQPDRDSGSKRIDDTVSFLLEAGWSVTFGATVPLRPSRHADTLRKKGVAVFHFSPEALAEHLSTLRYDVAIFCFWPTAELFLPVVRRVSPMTRVIVDSIDLHFLRHARRIAGLDDGASQLDAAFGDQLVGELNTYAAADLVWTVSSKEAALIEDMLGEPDRTRVVPDNEEVELGDVAFEARRGILFVGSFRHPPNIDAVSWLCGEVLPRLPRSLLGVHPVQVVGDALDAHIRTFGRGLAGVEMVGWVPSLAPYYRQARMSILPLLSGAGTKRKLIQTLMHGTPAVSTSIGAEGFALRNGTDILVADHPLAFAQAIERLAYDEALWQSLAQNGRQRILETHSRDIARRAVQSALTEAMERAPLGATLPARTYEDHHQRLVYQHKQSKLVSKTPRPIRFAAAEGMPGDRVPESGDRDKSDPGDVRLVAFYLPQFHPIPENDQWWGEGFTEWTNVRAAKPLFPGHEQPRVPRDLGYYDLRDPDVRWRQAELARSYGLSGFCYYHYWFDGKRLLERPFEEVLRSGEPDFPFALCWANEPWSRRWDGSEHDLLQPQAYSASDDLAHIRALLPALADPRAIRILGRPLLIVYQGWTLPDAARLTDIWRTEVVRAGLPGVHLLAVETGWDAGWDATAVGFDGKVRFQPQFSVLEKVPRIPTPEHPDLKVYPYADAWPVLQQLPAVPYRTYETVFPGWDNTPRRGPQGVVVHGGSPDAYGNWLRTAIDAARQRPPAERLVFINAWNEWAEGAYLEPDEAFGSSYLEATAAATRPRRPVRTTITA